MRGVIWLVLLFVVAVVAATTLGSNDGVVSIYWSGWRTDLSLNLFIIVLVVSCFVLMSAAQALNALVSLPRRASEWRALRRERAAQAALREALAEYFSARYSRAHKAATRALAIQADSPDLRDAQAALDRYFDRGSRRVVAALELVRQVSTQARLVNVPRPDATLAAIATANAGR